MLKTIKLFSIILFTLTACQVNTVKNVFPDKNVKNSDQKGVSENERANSSFLAINVFGINVPNSNSSVLSPSPTPTATAIPNPSNSPEPSSSSN